jgi:hypothetical protein
VVSPRAEAWRTLLLQPVAEVGHEEASQRECRDEENDGEHGWMTGSATVLMNPQDTPTKDGERGPNLFQGRIGGPSG